MNRNTVLGADITISSLTVNDTMPVTIGGANTLSLAATGLVTGININTGAGLTTISSDLQLGNLSQIVSVNNAAGLLISGNIGSTSGLTKAGTGVLTLTGTATYTGATVISNGTLRLGDGSTPGASIASSVSVLVAPDGTLALDLADVETFGNSVTNQGLIHWTAEGTNHQDSSSVFSGTGEMLITATGSTILLGDNTFTGGTTIDTPGEILLGNVLDQMSSPFGTGVLTIENGNIDTLNSQTLQIATGGYVQSGGEISMHLEGTNDGDYTRYIVTGTADLSGGTVFVYNRTGNYVPQGGDIQNIINTTGGLDGEFASNSPQTRFFNAASGMDIFFSQGSTLLYPTITYDLFNANITWVQDPFGSIPGLTPNQDAVADGLDAIPGLPGDLVDFLNSQNITDLAAVYDLISPDELTAIFRMGFTASEIQNANIRRHLDRVRQGSASQSQETYSTTDSKGGMVEQTRMTGQNNPWSVFVEGTGGSSSVDGDANAGGYDFDSMGVTVGADKRVSDNFAVGILAAYGKSDASLINGGSIDAESYKGAVYATAFNGGFFVDALLGAGVNSYDTRRASVGGFAEGSPDGWELNAMVNTGYDIRRGNWTFTPTASLAYTRVTLDGFNETGSLSPLSYPDQHQDSLRSELGARAAYTAVLGGIAVTPQVRLAWQHEFMDSTQTMDSNFIGGGGPGFTVSGPHMDRNRAVISAGVSARVTPTVWIYGFYDGHLGSSDYESNRFSAGVKVDF
jgi:outer membrane autotransporter protein